MTRRLSASIAVVALLGSGHAVAYERTMTCLEDGFGPYACLEDETPIPVAWPSRCVGFHINEAGSEDIPDFDAVTAAIEGSFETWSSVEGSYLELVSAGLTNENRPGYNKYTDNVNFVGFVEDGWEDYPAQALGLTSVTFSASEGIIVDADIELNSTLFTFGILDDEGGAGGVQDLANTVTHEAGHFVGLNHTLPDTFTGTDPRRYIEATMANTSPPGETTKRTLHDDDIAGIIAIYPASEVDSAGACEVSNEGYFDAPALAPGDEPDGERRRHRRCAASSTPGGPPSWGLVLVALLTVLRRRSPRGS